MPGNRNRVMSPPLSNPISTQNRFEMPRQPSDSQGQSDIDSDFVFAEQCRKKGNRSKRQRISTGSTDMTINEYNLLSNDEKLCAIFAQISSNGNKIGEIEEKINSCIRLESKVDYIDKKLSSYEERLKYLEYRSIDHETRNRRCNLFLGGFREVRGEDCSKSASDFFCESLDIEWPVHIERAYRFGKYMRGRTRPIFITLVNYCDVQQILSKAYLLRGTTYSINKDFPPEIASARKAIWATYKSIRERCPESKTVLAYPAKIIRDGEIILDRFPDWDIVMNSKHKINDIKSRSRNNTPTRGLDVPMSDHVTDNIQVSEQDKQPQNRTSAYRERGARSTTPSPTSSRRRERESVSPNSRVTKSPYVERGRTPTRKNNQKDHILQNNGSFSRPWTNNRKGNSVSPI